MSNETATIKKGTVSKQVSMPPAPVKVIKAMPSVDESREYLIQAGWVEVSRNDKGDSFWRDPMGSSGKGSREKKVELPGKDGTDPVQVTQVSCPPAPWNHPLHQAMMIQRGRDNVA
jgi:hypothetical protein